MSDAADGVEQTPGSLTRRNALRAGLAVGVGVAAWSGASITSLGGTPAYGATSTQVLPPIDLAGGCRNIDIGGLGCLGGYRYHDSIPSGDVPVAGFPANSFTVSPAIASGQCCTDGTTQTFTHPPDTSCQVFIRLFDGNPSCVLGAPIKNFLSMGPPTTGDITITYGCMIDPTGVPGDKYRITAICTQV